MAKKIKLGDLVKDNITEFKGIAIARAKYLYGCEQILVAPQQLTSEGQTADSIWFDDQRIELVERRRPPVSEESVATSGGPQNTPPKR